MKHTAFDWKPGTLDFWDLDGIDETRPFADQCDDLKEDLAQITFPNGIVLDIGWYPSFDPEGEFVVMVVQNSNWQTPLFRAVAKDTTTLLQQIAIGISASKQLARPCPGHSSD